LHLKPHETIAYHQYYDFVLRQSEADDWEAGRESLRDRKRPIEDRRQWYTVSVYSEPRLCRYRKSMKWPPGASTFPYNAGFVARERLPIRHYPHRDPQQLDRRCRLRSIMSADREGYNYTMYRPPHWLVSEWRKFVVPGDAEGLQHWAPGSLLPELHQTNHLAPPHRRLAQRLAHALLLPLLDRARPGWPEDACPQPMSPDLVATLEREMHS
jgi:hypothetical protein